MFTESVLSLFYFSVNKLRQAECIFCFHTDFVNYLLAKDEVLHTLNHLSVRCGRISRTLIGATFTVVTLMLSLGRVLQSILLCSASMYR